MSQIICGDGTMRTKGKLEDHICNEYKIEMINNYAYGNSTQFISDKLYSVTKIRITRQTVSNYLRKWKVKMRPRGGRHN